MARPSKARGTGNFPNQIIDIANKGADPTGVDNSTPAMDGLGGVLRASKGEFRLDSAPNLAAGSLLVIEDAVLTGAGATALGFVNGPAIQEIAPKSTATDYCIRRVVRDANHTGGSPGYVNSTIRVDLTVRDGVTNFEWGLVSVLQNYASAGENCGGYFQGNMRGTGTTFGSVSEAIDMSFTSSAGKGALIGMEIDCYFNAVDTDAKRIGLQVVAGDAQFNRTGTPGASGDATYGVVTLTQGGGSVCRFKNDFIALSGSDTAFQASSVGDKAFRVTGTYSTGLDLSGGTILGTGIRLAPLRPITWDVAQTVRTEYDGTGLKYAAGGTTRFRMRDDGTFESQLFTVAALPTPGTVGRRAFAVDLSSVAYRTTAAGGGTGKAPVFDDGGSWNVGG